MPAVAAAAAVTVAAPRKPKHDGGSGRSGGCRESDADPALPSLAGASVLDDSRFDIRAGDRRRVMGLN
jgi:hypothetical protein